MSVKIKIKLCSIKIEHRGLGKYAYINLSLPIYHSNIASNHSLLTGNYNVIQHRALLVDGGNKIQGKICSEKLCWGENACCGDIFGAVMKEKHIVMRQRGLIDITESETAKWKWPTRTLNINHLEKKYQRAVESPSSKIYRKPHVTRIFIIINHYRGYIR